MKEDKALLIKKLKSLNLRLVYGINHLAPVMITSFEEDMDTSMLNDQLSLLNSISLSEWDSIGN